MDETFGDVLRSLREAAGLSLSGLAARTHYTKAALSYIETGQRRPNTGVAQACDQALGTFGLLSDFLMADRDGDEVKRRAVLSALNILAAQGLRDPAKAVAESLRASILSALGGDDWPEIATEYGQRFMTDHPTDFLRGLAGDLLTLRQSIAESSSATVWLAAPKLMTLYGMGLANQGDVGAAARWYRSARIAADCTDDDGLQQWVRGRAAFRRSYEGATPDEVLATVADVTDVEAYLAVAQAHARLGNPSRALAAIIAARGAHETTDQCETTIYAMPPWRMALSVAYVYALLGDVTRCDAELAEVVPPPAVKRWEVQLELQRAVALARAGDISTGQHLAAAALRASPEDQKSTVVVNMWREVERCSAAS